MHPNKDDLEYTADGIRDRSVSSDETHIQASMQEETAKAIYALRDAVEELTEAVEEVDE